MALAFSSSDQAAIDRTVVLSAEDVKPAADDRQIECQYEVKRTVAWICENGFKKVALQFPDGMLVNSVSITLALQASVPAELFILGDTSYGSCCVDEVAAEHVAADAIVHYGHSCLSVPSRLPVLFILGRSPCTTEGLELGLRSVFPDPHTRIAVLFDTQYDHCKCDVFAKISALFGNAVCSELVIPSVQQGNKNRSRGTQVITKCSRTFCIEENTSLADYSILFIGPENGTLTNIVFTFNSCVCYSYNPNTQDIRRESLAVNRQLMRRYYLVEKAKDAHIVGILAGTLGVQSYLSAIGHLKKLIRNAGKKPYTLVTGKLNVAKLANFQEIDVYVLVACPENTLLDSKEFFQPIVTPFELELALNPSRQWSQTFSASFSDILLGGELHLELKEPSSQLQYDVSLVTGKIRSLGVEEKGNGEGSNSGGALVAKEGTVAVPKIHMAAAGEYLMNRTWQGLETRLGQTPAATISEGQVGLAAGYMGEGHLGQT